MDQKTLVAVVSLTKELIGASTCSAETKEAAQRWLDTVDTPSLKEETQKYIAELEEDIMPIDNLIAFAESQQGKVYFGSDTAAGIAAHGKEIRKAGAKYCDCPACAAAEKILALKDALLA